MSDKAAQLLNQAVAIVRRGGVIAYPTEAVWGLGCDPWNRLAVEKILSVKGRSAEKGLILIAASDTQLHPLLAPLTDQQRATLAEHWPGPFTFLIPDPNRWAPDWIRGQHRTVAVRVSDHPLVRQLCQLWGKPLVSTSANRAGAEALRSYHDVVALLAGEVDVVVEGATGTHDAPSQIYDLVTGQIVRN